MAACLSKDNPPSKTPSSAGGCVGRRGTRYHERMKTIAAFLIALLLVASPAAAQSSLEADMREAAAAYERKDMATAARLWKIWADKGNAEARTRWPPCTGAARAWPATTRKRPGATCWR